jgi:hypothetical protein
MPLLEQNDFMGDNLYGRRLLWATTFMGEVGRRCEVGLHPPLTQFFGYNPFLSLQNAAMSLVTEALGEVGRLSI